MTAAERRRYARQDNARTCPDAAQKDSFVLRHHNSVGPHGIRPGQWRKIVRFELKRLRVTVRSATVVKTVDVFGVSAILVRHRGRWLFAAASRSSRSDRCRQSVGRRY